MPLDSMYFPSRQTQEHELQDWADRQSEALGEWDAARLELNDTGALVGPLFGPGTQELYRTAIRQVSEAVNDAVRREGSPSAALAARFSKQSDDLKSAMRIGIGITPLSNIFAAVQGPAGPARG